MATTVETTGAVFAGYVVNVAFNISRCLTARVPKHECFTIFDGGSCKTKGKVVAYVDRVLLENVSFCVVESGVRRIREKGKGREVIAWARGTVRDPAKTRTACRLGKWDDWYKLTFCPYTDTTFMLEGGPQVKCQPGLERAHRPGAVVRKAKWAYFESHHPGVRAGVACLKATKNPARTSYPVRCNEHLSAMVENFGGSVG